MVVHSFQGYHYSLTIDSVRAPLTDVQGLTIAVLAPVHILQAIRPCASVGTGYVRLVIRCIRCTNRLSLQEIRNRSNPCAVAVKKATFGGASLI